MRGHIVKRGKSWSVVLELGKDTNGKRKQRWITVQGSKRDAEKQLTELLHQYDTGTFIEPDKTPMSEYLNKWLQDYARPNISPRGFERYEGIVSQHLIPAIGPIPLSRLRPEHLQKHYSDMLAAGLSPASVAYHHRLLHISLQTAVKWGLIPRNIADAVAPPKTHRPVMQIWDEYETNQFLEAAKGSHYYALFYTALFTGMRRSELLALRWQDIDFIYGQINVSRGMHQLKNGEYVFTSPKSAKSRRTIALPPSAFLVLEAYRKAREVEYKMLDETVKDSGLVFSTLGKPWRPNSVTRAWSEMVKKAGVKPIRLHDARHTHASLMLKQGIHPKVVQERLGHASIQMTLDTYSHVAPGIQEAAAASFDRLLKRNGGSKRVANGTFNGEN